MTHFRKIWDEEKNKWLLDHKDMPKKESYRLFMEKWPDSEVTETGYYNQRSRIGAVFYKGNKGGRKRRPLYAEHEKKGYVRIKVAMPNVWKSKSRWVYEETHPWEDFTERSNYIFLDGDTRNFSPENIERVPIKIMGIFNGLGGCAEGQPEITRIRVAMAKLKYEVLNAGDRLGETCCYGGGRMFKDERNQRRREYVRKPERAKKEKELRKIRYEKLKKENPLEFRRRAEKHKAYAREYYKRKKAERKTGGKGN